jgi:hypothetical protein
MRTAEVFDSVTNRWVATVPFEVAGPAQPGDEIAVEIKSDMAMFCDPRVVRCRVVGRRALLGVRRQEIALIAEKITHSTNESKEIG